MSEQLQLAPVPASIDNPGQWDTIAQQIALASGLPLTITPEVLLGMVGSAAPLIFEAQSAGDAGMLRGTFADPVVAQCQRNGVRLLSGEPVSAVVHLVGGRVADGHSVLRVHLAIEGQDAAGEHTVDRQFWDLSLGGQVTVGLHSCPNCGAPLAAGELVCGHCHTDVRKTVQVPLVVSRLELY
jgi:ribosomal protein S27AE